VTIEEVVAPAAYLPLSISSVFASTHRGGGRLAVPAALQLKVAFGELKLDLREAAFPHDQVLLVCESLCGSLEVLLPAGVAVADHSASVLSSHKVAQSALGPGPVVHVEGWSVCSDVKVVAAA
jgi:hypothetical protein